MEVENKKASVNGIWNDLKKDEAIRNTHKSAARTKVDWNSYHIRDAVKPKKKFMSGVRSCDSHLADYCLMEAAHLFRNSEGTLEVGCPYDCRSEKCRSSKREENNAVRVNWPEKTGPPGEGDRQPDLVILQYAKLKAAYQEKLKKEKLASLTTYVEEMKEDIDEATELQEQEDMKEDVDEDAELQKHEEMSNDDSVQILPAENGNRNTDKEEPQDGDEDEGLRSRAHLADEASERFAKRPAEGYVPYGTVVDYNAKDDEQFLATNSERAKSLVAEQEPAKRDSSDFDNVKVAPSSEFRSVRFALPEESRDAATTDNGIAEDNSEHQSLANALSRDLNSLTDAVAGVRLAALERLQSTLFGSTLETPEEGGSYLDRLQLAVLGSRAETREEGSYAQNGGEERSRVKEESMRHSLGWAAEELVIKPLLRRFGDPSEKCRILAIVILQK